MHASLEHRVLALVFLVATLVGCRTYVRRWDKIEAPYDAAQFDGKGEIWLRTKRHEWCMKAPQGGRDERGEYVEGKTQRQPMTIGPIEAVRTLGEGVYALAASDSDVETRRVYVDEVRELRREPPNARSGKSYDNLAVLFWLGLYAALAFAAF